MRHPQYGLYLCHPSPSRNLGILKWYPLHPRDFIEFIFYCCPRCCFLLRRPCSGAAAADSRFTALEITNGPTGRRTAPSVRRAKAPLLPPSRGSCCYRHHFLLRCHPLDYKQRCNLFIHQNKTFFSFGTWLRGSWVLLCVRPAERGGHKTLPVNLKPRCGLVRRHKANHSIAKWKDFCYWLNLDLEM